MERLRIGFVGTLFWHKGVHVLLDAVRALPEGRFEVKLFGDTNVFPPYVATLKKAAEGLPVEFMGGFDETRTRDVYASIDVLVVPSIWPENSPLVIHEAFMAGVPVIGSRQGGIPELVTHGESGLLFDSGSSSELAAVICSLIEHPERLHLLRSNLPAVKSIDNDAREWESIYSDLALRHRQVAHT